MPKPDRSTRRRTEAQKGKEARKGVEVILEFRPDLKRQAQALLIVLGFGREAVNESAASGGSPASGA